MKTIPSVEKLSVKRLRTQLTVPDRFWPGDVVLSENPHGSLVSGTIRISQFLALTDLPSVDVPTKVGWAAARYTHTMIAKIDGVNEQTYPESRFRTWEELKGIDLLWVRPSSQFLGPSGPGVMRKVVNESDQDVELATLYPVRELFYYLKWSSKVIRNYIPFMRDKSFFEYFNDGDDDVGVCSAMVMRWLMGAGVMPDDLNVNAWYPARFAVDPFFEIVTAVRLV